MYGPNTPEGCVGCTFAPEHPVGLLRRVRPQPWLQRLDRGGRANGTGDNLGTRRSAGVDTTHDTELMALSVFELEDGATGAASRRLRRHRANVTTAR